jgi:sulfide:quinone oxidoreductase
MNRITIIGSGFGALAAVRQLRRRDTRLEITLIAPQAEFVYSPSLIWVPTGIRRGEDLRVPLDGFLRRHNVTFHQGRVTAVHDGGRTVATDNGEVTNDGLLIASGGRFLKKLPGIEHAFTLCEGIESAQQIRDRLHGMSGGTLAFGFGTNPNEPSAMRGGPMFELMFGIETWLRRVGKRNQFRLVFFNAAKEPGKRLGDRAVKGLLAEMQKRGVETHLGHKLLGFDARAVKTEGGDFDADLIMFMPGMTGPAWLADSGFALSPGGFLKADAHCRVEGAERVFVIGDSGSYPGPDWMPKQAHMADLQAKAAVPNLLAALNGQPARERFKVELICVVDTLDKGILVYRDLNRGLVFPARLLHQAKRFFEWSYLRAYRAA